MLAAYQTQFTALIQAPSSPTPLITTAAMNTYINAARNQVAGEGECIRSLSTLGLVSGQLAYGFSAIDTIAPGVQSVIAVRLVRINNVPIDLRPWEWFSNYYLGQGANGTPVRAAQYNQGVSGSLYFNPIPNGSFTASIDAVCLPIPLVNDSTTESIPYPWTDAVPFYAAWLGMMNEQRQSDADRMLVRYEDLMLRARRMSSPSVLPGNLPGDAGARAAASKTTMTGAGSAPPAQAAG